MGTNEKMSPIGQPVPEWPVADAERARRYYRNALGFEMDGFITQANRLGPSHAAPLILTTLDRYPPPAAA